jgi:hypothetical protein
MMLHHPTEGERLASSVLKERAMSRLVLAALGILAWACGSSPTEPTANSSIVFAGVSPPSGNTVVVPEEYPYNVPGGVIIPRGSGLIAVTLSITSAREVPWGQLNVYLLTGGQSSDYCGQNLPDSPTWRSLPSRWTTTYTVSGFQVYRLPCDVTGIRAVLHTRNSGLLIPPMPGETIAEATLSASYQIRRASLTAMPPAPIRYSARTASR